MKKTAIIVARVVAVVGCMLLFDYLFYVHMNKRWGLLQINIASYWSRCVTREWSVDDIVTLFGKPDIMTTNVIVYTAYDFGFSKWPLPFVEIVFSGSDDHFYKHEIEFFYDSNSIIRGSSDSESRGLREQRGERDLRIKRFESESQKTGIWSSFDNRQMK
jgi:hypothetical protein